MPDLAAAPVPVPAPEQARARFARARFEAFALTWLVYFAFYLTRRDFDGAKPAMMAPHDGLPGDYTKADLARLDTLFLGSYAAGHFVAGPLGDWLGARRVVLFGMATTIAANIVFGLAHPLPLLAVAIAINGLAQAFGYPQCCKIIAAWFSPAMRGRASSWFLTSYTLGDIAAKALAGAMVNHVGWRWAFFAPAGIVTGFLALLYLRLRASPRELGLPLEGETEIRPAAPGRHRFGAELVLLLKRPAVWLVSLGYFLLKMARYTFLGWSNVFLFEQLGYSPGDATLATIPIAVGGLFGTLASGYVSDRVFQGRRAPVAIACLLSLAVLTPLYGRLVAGEPWRAMALHLAIGFFLFAADTLMSMATSMDLGGEGGAASAAGFINGAGSVGATLSPLLGAWASTRFGWTHAWYFLAAMLALGALVMVPRWNKKGGR